VNDSGSAMMVVCSTAVTNR